MVHPLKCVPHTPKKEQEDLYIPSGHTFRNSTEKKCFICLCIKEKEIIMFIFSKIYKDKSKTLKREEQP